MSTDRSQAPSWDQQEPSYDDEQDQGPVAVPHRASWEQAEEPSWSQEQSWSTETAPAQPAEEPGWSGQTERWQQGGEAWTETDQAQPAEEPGWSGQTERWQQGGEAWTEPERWSQQPPSGSPPPPATAPPSASAPPVQPSHQQQSSVRPNTAPPPSLNDESLLHQRRPTSSRGWRRAVSTVTLGTVRPGLSPAELAEQEQMRLIRTPIRGCHRIGVVSLKGGIGKTTTAAGLGLALATTRGDGVVAVDANPDAGTLADRLVGSVPSPYEQREWVGAHVRATDDVWIAPRSVRDLLAAVSAAEIGSATDVMRYMSIAGRLHVLASEQDPETSEAFSADEYRVTAEVISAFYSVMLTDTGTGLLHSAMAGMLSMANSLVIIAAPSVDGASRAAKTLDWLEAHHYGHLVLRCVVAVSHTRPRSQDVDMSVLDRHFSARTRAVVHIPYDPHLVAGSVIRWKDMASETRSAFLKLAALIAEDFREGWNGAALQHLGR